VDDPDRARVHPYTRRKCMGDNFRVWHKAAHAPCRVRKSTEEGKCYRKQLDYNGMYREIKKEVARFEITLEICQNTED